MNFFLEDYSPEQLEKFIRKNPITFDQILMEVQYRVVLAELNQISKEYQLELNLSKTWGTMLSHFIYDKLTFRFFPEVDAFIFGGRNPFKRNRLNTDDSLVNRQVINEFLKGPSTLERKQAEILKNKLALKKSSHLTELILRRINTALGLVKDDWNTVENEIIAKFSNKSFSEGLLIVKNIKKDFAAHVSSAETAGEMYNNLEDIVQTILLSLDLNKEKNKNKFGITGGERVYNYVNNDVRPILIPKLIDKLRAVLKNYDEKIEFIEQSYFEIKGIADTNYNMTLVPDYEIVTKNKLNQIIADLFYLEEQSLLVDNLKRFLSMQSYYRIFSNAKEEKKIAGQITDLLDEIKLIRNFTVKVYEEVHILYNSNDLPKIHNNSSNSSKLAQSSLGININWYTKLMFIQTFAEIAKKMFQTTKKTLGRIADGDYFDSAITRPIVASPTKVLGSWIPEKIPKKSSKYTDGLNNSRNFKTAANIRGGVQIGVINLLLFLWFIRLLILMDESSTLNPKVNQNTFNKTTTSIERVVKQPFQESITHNNGQFLDKNSQEIEEEFLESDNELLKSELSLRNSKRKQSKVRAKVKNLETLFPIEPSEDDYEITEDLYKQNVHNDKIK